MSLLDLLSTARRRLLLSSIALLYGANVVSGAVPGGFELAGDSMVGGMMVFLGNEKSVYILDKAEDNKAQVNGHAAWGSVWSFETHRTVVQDVPSNSFCASGMHLPNGSWATFGGNDAVTVGGAAGSDKNPDGTGNWDNLLQDHDGRRAIRVVNPCTIQDNLDGNNCKWYDHFAEDGMKRARWYSTSEATGDGRIVIIGGMVRGGFINRQFPVTDPITQNGQSEPTYEYFPPKAEDPPRFQFLIDAGGLNTYPHTFLMPDGRFFVQANLSSILWDHDNNRETKLPDMPKNVVRVYPASGGAAMLPLTPENDYTPTILFCGGQDIPTDGYGSYGSPNAAVWEIPASKDCQRITPLPSDKSAPAYEQDDEMPEGRTMGQIIALPDGKYLMLNGAGMGTAGYSTGGTPTVPASQMPHAPSLAENPVLRPAIYDPSKPRGQRWSTQGLIASTIPRMYHSSAILLPDASVFVAGSNTHPDVNLTHFYPTEYRIEIFYPPYFSANRPTYSGAPKTLSYGGAYFNITLPPTAYTGDAKAAAEKSKIVVARSGFTTHAMNMGQRHLQLKNTYTVFKDGSIILHVAQMPPNANLFQPGPALLFVTVDGIPSNGTHLIVGNGQVGTQPVSAEATLPPSSVSDKSLSGTTGTGTGKNDTGTKGTTDKPEEAGGISKTVLIAAIAGGVALVLIVGAIVLMRRRSNAAPASQTYPTSSAGPLAVPSAPWNSGAGARNSDAESYQQLNRNGAWGDSRTSLAGSYDPYADSYAMANYKDSPGAQSMGRFESSDHLASAPRR